MTFIRYDKKDIKTKDFVAKFDSIRGESSKRVSKESLIMNKQFYYVAEHKPELITSDTLLETIMEHWYAARPINDYFGGILNK